MVDIHFVSWDICQSLTCARYLVKGRDKTTRRKTKQNKTKLEKNIQKLWDTNKRCNIHEMGLPEGEERNQGVEEIFEATMFLSQLLTLGLTF